MDLEKKIDRINELARKAKHTQLSDEELEERNELRKSYIDAFKQSLRNQLDTIKIVDDEENNK